MDETANLIIKGILPDHLILDFALDEVDGDSALAHLQRMAKLWLLLPDIRAVVHIPYGRATDEDEELIESVIAKIEAIGKE